MKILAVGDSFMPVTYFEQGLAQLEPSHEIALLQVDPEWPFTPTTASELKLREYQGSPEEVAGHLADVDVLVFQGAPVTEAVLEAGPRLRLLGCARGGPVNIDLAAVNARGLPLVNTPGKNAEAVADQTIAFLVMLARRFPKAQRFLEDGNQVKDNWEGSNFLGHDLAGHTLGLIGYGQVGQRVAARALGFGLTILVHDPFVEIVNGNGVERVDTLAELLERSDFLSLHARATAENENLVDAAALAKLRPGSFLVNTARETLVDEDALDDALASGRLAGAALDVVRPREGPGRHRLLRHENVVLTPHIGGATHETLVRAATMLAEEIERFSAGEALVNVVNRQSVTA